MPIRLKRVAAVVVSSLLLGAPALLSSVTGCSGTTTGAGASAGALPDASAGAGQGGGHDAEATSGAGQYAGGAGLLDTSPTGGPCGQFITGLETACAGWPAGTVCTLGSWDCATFKAASPSGLATVQSGCGYLFIYRELGEGDAQTMIYEQSTGHLVFYSSVGAQSIGCAERGMRIGHEVACQETRAECANTAGDAAGASAGP